MVSVFCVVLLQVQNDFAPIQIGLNQSKSLVQNRFGPVKGQCNDDYYFEQRRYIGILKSW